MEVDTNSYKNTTLLNWVNSRKRGLVKIDSVNKVYELESSEERSKNVDEINYISRIESGYYNTGAAIRCGWGIGHEHFGIGIDLDGRDAITAWFGGDSWEETWERVKQYANNNLVEWHEDDSSLHLVIYLKEAIENTKIPLPGHSKEHRAQIEIQGEGKLLCVSPSETSDKNHWTAMGSEEIPLMDQIDKLKLKSKIHTILKENTFRDYLNEHENQSLFEWLHYPNTIFGVRGGRHDWTLWIINSYFWKWSGEWLDLSDEERFKRAWEWHIAHCEPARSREEFERICRDVSRKYIEQRDKKHHEIKQKRRSPTEEMPGCISYEIKPGTFITGTIDNKVAEITRKFEQNEQTGQAIVKLKHVKTFTACKPVRIIKHNNPLTFLELRQKYTIEFKGNEPSGCFTLKQKSIPEIIAKLNDGNALTERGLEIMLQAQLKGFEQAKKLEESDSMDYSGFFPVGNKIIASNISLPLQYPNVADALGYIETLRTKYYVGREDFLAHILLWFMIAPCSFIFKVIGATLLEWLYPHGYPNAGKTTSGLIGLGIDGNDDNQDFNLNMKHIDSSPRFGKTIGSTTFPKVINEIDLLGDFHKDTVNDIVTAVDSVRFRKTLDTRQNETQTPGLSPLFLTGNPPPPTRPEFLKRVRCRYASVKEVHLPTSQEAKDYKKWLMANIKRSHALGHFRNKWVMDNQEIILNKELTPLDKSKKIWTAIYESVGRKLPDFFNLKLEENQMQSAIEDRRASVLGALEAWIVDKCRALDTNTGIHYGSDGMAHGLMKILDEYTESIDRLKQLVDRNLVPYVKRDKNNKIIFYRQILTDLEKYGVKNLDLPALADAIINSTYGSHDGYRVVKCSVDDLTWFFSGSSESSDPSDRQGV